MVHDIDNEIEIDGYEYCEVCMTLSLHDTDIHTYHRAMITVDRPIDSYFVLSFLSRDRGIIGRLIRDSDHRSTELE